MESFSQSTDVEWLQQATVIDWASIFAEQDQAELAEEHNHSCSEAIHFQSVEGESETEKQKLTTKKRKRHEEAQQIRENRRQHLLEKEREIEPLLQEQQRVEKRRLQARNRRMRQRHQQQQRGREENREGEAGEEGEDERPEEGENENNNVYEETSRRMPQEEASPHWNGQLATEEGISNSLGADEEPLPSLLQREMEEAYEKTVRHIEKAGGEPKLAAVPPFVEAQLNLSDADACLAKWLELKTKNRWSRATLLEVVTTAQKNNELLQAEHITEHRLRQLQKKVDVQLGALKATSTTFYFTTKANKRCQANVAYIPCEWFLRQAFAQPTLAFEMESWTEHSDTGDIYRYDRWQQLVLNGELDNPCNVMLGLYFDDYQPAKFADSPQLKLSSLRLVPLNYRNKVRADVYNWWTPVIFPTKLLHHFDRTALLAPFFEEMKSCLESGIQVYNAHHKSFMTITCRVVVVIADLPAKAFLTHSQASFSLMKAWCVRCFGRRKNTEQITPLKTANDYRTIGEIISTFHPSNNYRKTLVSQNNMTGKSPLFTLQGLEPAHIVNDLMHNELQNGCLGRNVLYMQKALKEGKAWSDIHDQKLNRLIEKLQLPHTVHKPKGEYLFPTKASHKFSTIAALILALPSLQETIPCACGVTKSTPPHLVAAFNLPTNSHTSLDHYICCKSYLLLASQLFCRSPPYQLDDFKASLQYQRQLFEHLYGSASIVPKMHYAGHYTEDLKLWGSLRHVWCFAGERLNGLEGKEQSNWHQDAASRLNQFQRQRAFHHFHLTPSYYNKTSTAIPIASAEMTTDELNLVTAWVETQLDEAPETPFAINPELSSFSRLVLPHMEVDAGEVVIVQGVPSFLRPQYEDQRHHVIAVRIQDIFSFTASINHSVTTFYGARISSAYIYSESRHDLPVGSGLPHVSPLPDTFTSNCWFSSTQLLRPAVVSPSLLESSSSPLVLLDCF